MASETNIEPNVRQAQSKELFLKEKALTIAKAFKFGEGTVLGEQLDRFPLLNRKRAFVVCHHIGGID